MNFLQNIFNRKQINVKSNADFWRWFQQHEKAFFNVVKNKDDIEKNFLDHLSPKLNSLRPGYFMLTGMYNDDTAELILTVDGSIQNIVFAEDLVNDAPALSRWKFTALKPPMDISKLVIHMNNHIFSGENINFYSNEDSHTPDEIDITFVHDDLDDTNNEIIANGTLIFLDNFLGELNFATSIDSVTVIGRKDAEKQLVPVEKLPSFLIWREKEFIEKYEGVRYDMEEDAYAILEAELENGNVLLAVINTNLLNWDAKASHPWLLEIQIKYDGSESNGMPDQNTYQLLEQLEESILAELTAADGYLNIGRQTADSEREIYFACKDFRKPSKVLDLIKQQYAKVVPVAYYIYKDKYWKSYDRFNRSFSVE